MPSVFPYSVQFKSEVRKDVWTCLSDSNSILGRGEEEKLVVAVRGVDQWFGIELFAIVEMLCE